MQLSNAPAKLVLPFANAGAKNDIPVDSQIGIVAGAASLVDGFPPLTRTPIAAGGTPPSGLDMNGILYELSALLRWLNAGAGFVYDSTFAADSNVGGYPKGACLMRSDGLGYWRNTVDNNTTDPEAAGAAVAGWVPEMFNGVAAVTMTNANVTLTPLQYGMPIVVITGTLTANLNLIFPAIAGGEWLVVNNTTGNFTVTCKTASGSGFVAAQTAATRIWGDGTNINLALSAGSLLNVQRINATGTYTPTPGTKSVVVEVQGGGGGGGGSAITSGTQYSIGGGGGGGSYAKGRFTAAQIGASVAVTIGAGGTSGTNAANGGNGGTTSFGALISAPGGIGGSTGDAITTTTTRLIGGGAGGATASGGNLLNGTGIDGGDGLNTGGNGAVTGFGGGSPIAGGAGGGPSTSVGANGVTASCPGAGGSGAGSNVSDATGKIGGAGAGGLVIVWEFA